jgi:hypothetical protein
MICWALTKELKLLLPFVPLVGGLGVVGLLCRSIVRSRQWPAVNGIVLEHDYERSDRSAAPVIYYAYAVESKRYVSRRIAIDGPFMGSSSAGYYFKRFPVRREVSVSYHLIISSKI